MRGGLAGDPALPGAPGDGIQFALIGAGGKGQRQESAAFDAVHGSPLFFWGYYVGAGATRYVAMP